MVATVHRTDAVMDWNSTGPTLNWTGTDNSTIASENQRNRGPSDADYYFVWVYISPVILVVGVVGNVLTLLVMSRRRLRGSSTCVYLSALAVADTVALVFRIPPEFFEAARIFTFKNLSRWTCKVEKFTFYTASDAAIWILVAFTVDRLIAVTLPLVKHSFCAPRRALAACLTIVFVAVGKNFHVFWTRDVEVTSSGRVKVCGRPQPYRYFEDAIRPWMAFILVSVLPFVVISICNCLIVIALLRAHRMRRRTSVGKSWTAEDQEEKKGPAKNVVFTQTSLMCIAASIAFVVCVTPSIVLTMGRSRWIDAGGLTQEVYFAVRAVVHQLACLNHAINFFLYCVTGQRFRTELVALIRRERSSVSAFEASTRRYYMEQAARRSTQTSTSFLAMQTVSLTVPKSIREQAMKEEPDDDDRDSLSGRANNNHR